MLKPAVARYARGRLAVDDGARCRSRNTGLHADYRKVTERSASKLVPIGWCKGGN